jgi:opacity protein-like surface antigen
MKILQVVLLTGAISIASAETYVDANIGLNTSWNTFGLNANAGYMFNPYIGAEGGFTYSPGNTSSSTYGAYYMFDAAAKGVLPLSSIFSLYGKLGVGYSAEPPLGSCTTNCGNTSSNIGLLVGAGAQFNLSKSWSLHVEDFVVTGPNPNMLMVGGQFKF